jgi:SAM-dependent methyltransferase
MTERYDTAAAAHYAAYRPPLHAALLNRVLGKSARFSVGVDVGCGTGHSTVALVERCERAIGIDSSASMLREAVPHERVSYLSGTGASVPVPDGEADVITFAGSLHYADSAATRSEVRRVGRSGTIVVVYDFELLLEPVLSWQGISLPGSDSDYDHEANFSGREGFMERSASCETVDVEMLTHDFAHVVLSDSNRLDHLARLYAPSAAMSPSFEA